jgi:hypothetical protein
VRVLRLNQCFSNLFRGGTPKITFHIPKTLCHWKRIYKVVQIWPGQTVACLHIINPGHIWTTLYIYIYKETVVVARRLLLYLQLSDKNSRDISRCIYNFFAVFWNGNVLIPLLLSEPLTVFCETLGPRGTLHKKDSKTFLHALQEESHSRIF